MSNVYRGLVEIELDKTRQIRFTLNALAELEDKLGVSLSELEGLNMGVKQIRTFLWAGLLHEEPELSEQAVGNMVDFDNIEYINEKINEAFQRATQRKN